MDLPERMGTRLLYLVGALFLTASMPRLLRHWRARQAWVKVRATVNAVDPSGHLQCSFPSGSGTCQVSIPPFGEAQAAAGDTVELHHPPGRPEAATHGSAFGHLAAAGLSGLLALVCWAGVFGAI